MNWKAILSFKSGVPNRGEMETACPFFGHSLTQGKSAVVLGT